MRQVDLKEVQFISGTIDSHFHTLECKKAIPEIDKEFTPWFKQGLRGILDVAITTLDFEERLKIFDSTSPVWFTAGIHPNYCVSQPLDSWEKLEEQASHPRVIAIGETGLDWYRGKEYANIQYETLERQLDIAKRNHLPVIIHNRDADEDLFRVLKNAQLEPGGILHCFSSNWSYAVKFLDLNFHLSFSGNVTYKNAYDIQDTCARIPQNRYLVETDAPYLAPIPHRGSSNHPGNLRYTLEKMAQLREITPQKTAEETRDNFMKFFSSVFQNKNLNSSIS